MNGKIGTPENFVFLGTYTKLLGGGEIFKYEAQSRNLIENSNFCSYLTLGYRFSLITIYIDGLLNIH